MTGQDGVGMGEGWGICALGVRGSCWCREDLVAGGGGGGGGTYLGYWYPLQNGPRDLWLPTWSI